MVVGASPEKSSFGTDSLRPGVSVAAMVSQMQPTSQVEGSSDVHSQTVSANPISGQTRCSRTPPFARFPVLSFRRNSSLMADRFTIANAARAPKLLINSAVFKSSTRLASANTDTTITTTNGVLNRGAAW